MIAAGLQRRVGVGAEKRRTRENGFGIMMHISCIKGQQGYIAVCEMSDETLGRQNDGMRTSDNNKAEQ